jgi:transposase
MKLEAVLGLPEALEVVSGEVAGEVITLTVISTQVNPCCPLCGRSASRVHSHYRRQLTDMSCAGRQVRLILHVRKFFCDEKTCTRKIFTERLAPFIHPWARVTTRLFQAMEQIGLATGGMLGARLGDRLGMPTSWMTVLRRIMARPSAAVNQVVQLGIDDFSFRRGRRFGTILVDMQSHAVIDLLPDRQTETTAAWMSTHPEIDLVSRDRGGDYASAAALAAPQAMQCADRFHLLKNLREALEGLLAHHLAQERKRHTQATVPEQVPIWYSKRAPRSSPHLEQLQQARREERMALYDHAMALHQQGLSQHAIAEQVRVGHSTISRWLAQGRFPERKPREQVSQLDRYLPYLYERWAAGYHNMAGLFRELGEQGYTGSYASVRDTLLRLLPEGRKTSSALSSGKRAPLLARQATFFFLRQSEELEADERETLALLLQLDPEITQAYALVQQFVQMLRTRTGNKLDDWLETVRTSQIRAFQSFVAGIERDKAAVVAGLTLPLNNGLVEGKVNKLKLIKRMMYGRAAFPLLRQRVLHAL